MKKLLAASIIAALGLVPAGAIASPAKSPTKTISAKTVKFAGGKLIVKRGKSYWSFVVNKKTDCGYSTGQMGDSMPCSNLRKSRYMNKRVTVSWQVRNGKRVADLVAVQL